jgi:hypothetical protein
MQDHDPIVASRQLLLACATLLAATILTERAEACGGFFCNRPQNPDDLPVAQTGENVLFAMDRTPTGTYQLEAHIQIFYTGPADKFSWVVPVDGLPTLDVGSNRVFQVLEPATRPRFTLTVEDDGECDGGARPSSFGCGGSSTAKLDSAGARPNDNSGDVEVVFKGNVGPYDALVVRADDPQKLKSWLAENQYYLSDQGNKLIDDYVREQKYFVALKLLSGRGVSEIQPIVLRFEGPGPCVPLRLTAVASIADLRVSLWVLGRSRVVPENYFEIAVNEAKIDWLRSGQNYPDLLKQAANEAGGNAFAVEYAGPTDLLRGKLVPAGGYDLSRLRTITAPPDALAELTRLGFPRDAALLAILRQYIPEPAALRDRGVEETAFYNQIAQYWLSDRMSFLPLDGARLASAIEEGVVQPLVKAQALFDGHLKLTRLATFISPEEMSLDPTFIENSSLPDVPVVRQAQGHRMCGQREHTRCDAPLKVVLPSGRPVWFEPPKAGGWCAPPSTPYDRAAVDATPSLEVGWKREALGEGRVAFDNRAAINAAVEMKNAELAAGGCSCSLGGRVTAAPMVVLAAALAVAFRRRLRRRR